MFDIKHTACNTVHRCNEVIYHIENRDFFILIYTKTEAVFEIDGCKQIVAEGSIVLLPPDVKALYYGNSNEYIDDWINFYDTQGVLASMGIANNDFSDCGIPFACPLIFGPDSPVGAYFMLIANAFHSGLAQSKAITDNLMLALFEFIKSRYAENKSIIPHYNAILSIRQEIYANPQREYRIPSLARCAWLSSIYFQELYKKAFGISCGADIINSRIENARRLLSETAYTIEQIAERCGYNNSIHFSRQFKQVMGVAPSKWRSTH